MINETTIDWRIKLLACFGVLVMAQLAGVELAQAAGGGVSGAFKPLVSVGETMVDVVTGPIGRIIAIITIFGLGAAAFIGRLSWLSAGFWILGIGLVFGGPSIVDELIGVVGKK